MLKTAYLTAALLLVVHSPSSASTRKFEEEWQKCNWKLEYRISSCTWVIDQGPKGGNVPKNTVRGPQLYAIALSHRAGGYVAAGNYLGAIADAETFFRYERQLNGAENVYEEPRSPKAKIGRWAILKIYVSHTRGYRAYANLRLGRYAQAEQDADYREKVVLYWYGFFADLAVRFNMKKNNALLRGEIALGKRDFGEAVRYFKEYVEFLEQPETKSAPDQLPNARLRLAEAEKLLAEPSRSEPPPQAPTPAPPSAPTPAAPAPRRDTTPTGCELFPNLC